MTGIPQQLHFADLARCIGWTYLQSRRNEADISARITAVQNAGLHMIVGLDSVEMILPADEVVRLCSPADKVAHLRCGHRCNGGSHKGTTVPAGDLKGHIGSLAFVNAGSGPGPHIIIDCKVEDEVVHLTTSSSEVVGTFDMLVRVTPPEA